MNLKFSVLMSVYNGEKVDFFKEAIESVLNQTVVPDEIVLIRDGYVYAELQEAIDLYRLKFPNTFTYVPLETNKGLGIALNIGVSVARNDLVARMDTDDICLFDRFEKQLAYLENNPDVSVCGGQIQEFIYSKDKIEGERRVPEDHNKIASFIRSRNPFNHMTVMFRKSAVIRAGNYQDMHYVEDYYLWCRMLLNGCRFGNLRDVLVYARIGKDMYRRRGGYEYFKSWRRLEKFKKDNGITSFGRYVKTLILRFVVQVLTPNFLRGVIIKKFARQSKAQR